MRTALCVFLLLVLACGGETARTDTATTTPAGHAAAAPPPPPSADEARTLVAGSPEFSEYQFTHAAYSLPLQQSAMAAPARDVARDLAKAGWIGVDGAGTVVLTDKAKTDKRFIVRPNGVVDIVPLARKEFLAVESVETAPDGAPLVHFRWEWVPNEIGKLFGPRYEGEQHATATLMRYGSEWAVLRIVPKATS